MQYINPYIELCLEGSDSVFKGLSQKEKEIIANHHTISIFKKGEYIFKEGDKVRGLICLASGKAKTYKNGVGRQGERRHAEKHQHNEGGAKIPRLLWRWRGRQSGRVGALRVIEKLKAVLALDGLILDFFRAVGAFFHGRW
jgi:hypothetical protein